MQLVTVDNLYWLEQAVWPNIYINSAYLPPAWLTLLIKNIIFLWEVSCVRAFELHAKTLESPWMHVKSNRGSFMNEHLKNLRWDKFVKMYMLIDRHLHLHFFFKIWYQRRSNLFLVFKSHMQLWKMSWTAEKKNVD